VNATDFQRRITALEAQAEELKRQLRERDAEVLQVRGANRRLMDALREAQRRTRGLAESLSVEGV